MRSIPVLAALAARLNREAGAPPIPSLYFFTDPARTPDPAKIAEHLPEGAAVVFRHFGKRDRVSLARRLARVCAARRLLLLIAADPQLAQHVGADGVHWPEKLMPARRLPGARLQIAATHSRQAMLRAATGQFDACVLAPVFESRSPSATRSLGIVRAGTMARQAGLPVIALGGVNAETARQLTGRGFAGLAAVDAFLSA